MYYTHRLLVLLLITLLVSACGGEDAFNGGGCNPADTPTVIGMFSVTGVSTDSVSGLEVIDDTGDFMLSWDLDSSCSYTYSAYLSANNELGLNDIEFSSGTCGFGHSCGYSADISCSFDAVDKSISCDSGSAIDVSAALPDPSPQTPYIFFTASNEMGDEPAPESQQVQVEF